MDPVPHTPFYLVVQMLLLGVWGKREVGGGRMGDGCMKCPIGKGQLTDEAWDRLNTSHRGSGR